MSVGAAIAALAVTVLQVPSQAQAKPKIMSDAQIGTMSASAQGRLLTPLRDAASALGMEGASRTGSGVFSGVVIDANRRQVDLYVVDIARGRALIKAAKQASPSIDTSLVQIHKAAYTLVDLKAARVHFLSQKHSFETLAIGPRPDGSTLLVEVSDPAAAKRAAPARVGDVVVDFEHGTKRVSKVYHAPKAVAGERGRPTSDRWAAAKWHDSTPFIGGDVVTPDGQA